MFTSTALAVSALAMIGLFMTLILTKRVSPTVALILVPMVFGMLIAPSFKDLTQWILDGFSSVAKVGIMLTFAILYFSLMLDCGLFEPLVLKIKQLAKGDPLKVLVGSAVLSLGVGLDGDGSSTYLIVCSAMLPICKKLSINPLKLTTIIMLAGGVTNILVWGGPTARVMSALALGADQVFTPLILPMIAGSIWTIAVAYWFGLSERKRLGGIQLEIDTKDSFEAIDLPKFFWFNLSLTIGILVALVNNILPLSAIFMIGSAFALLINFPKMEAQRTRINEHAGNVLQVVLMVFAAGMFAGVANGSGMLKALGDAFATLIPASLGGNMAVITAFMSMPFTFFMENNSFYNGIVPVFAATSAHYGIPAAEIACASLLGQPVHLLSPLVPSTYLLVGLADVNFGDHLRHTLKWAIGTVIVMTITALLTGVIHFRF